jgi:hypothetical protein
MARIFILINRFKLAQMHKFCEKSVIINIIEISWKCITINIQIEISML